MEANVVDRAEKYYQLISEKNIREIKGFLDANVEFSGPLATLQGKEAVIEATSNFMKMFKSLKIRAKFGTDDQAMIVYDVDIPEVIEKFPGASLLSFRDGLIVRIELFYDGSFFVEKKEEIFS
ncbi:MAG: nuclear transport factor 2 family protein [Waddliaceae bacterium]